MEDFLLIEIPRFKPEYNPDETYGYRKEKEKNNLKAVLEKSTDGFCMYCFSRIRVDGKLYANLEHAIEKSNSDKLIECVPDIGISCMVCNQSLKRRGEKKRKIPENVIRKYEKNSFCSVIHRKQCTVPCKALRELQESYSCLTDAEIILQPMGTKGCDSGEPLLLQYNVMNMIFEPAKDTHIYSDKELRFINLHITRFRLNNPGNRSRQLYDFIKNVIDSNGNLPMYECNNLVVKLFREKLLGKSQEEILKICKSIYMISFTKMQGI